VEAAQPMGLRRRALIERACSPRSKTRRKLSAGVGGDAGAQRLGQPEQGGPDLVSISCTRFCAARVGRANSAIQEESAPAWEIRCESGEKLFYLFKDNFGLISLHYWI